MVETALENAILLIKKGQIDEGKEILIRLIKNNPQHERAWSWLYACAKNDKQRIYCLRKVLSINPTHERAQAALVKLERKSITDNYDAQTETKLQFKKALKLQSKTNCTDNYLLLNSNLYPGVNNTSKGEDQSRNELDTRSQNKHTIVNDTVKPQTNEDIIQPVDVNKDNDNLSVTPQKKTPKNTELHPRKSTLSKGNTQRPNIIVVNYKDKPFGEQSLNSEDIPDINSGMHRSSLLLGDIRITPRNHPECIELGHIPSRSRCDVCEYFEVSQCHFYQDPTLLHETIILFNQALRFWREYEQIRRVQVEAIHKELLAHGRPLHYEVIEKIMKDRYPTYFLSGWAIVRIMSLHPERFLKVEKGVYRAT